MKICVRRSMGLVACVSILFAWSAGGQVADAPDANIAGIPVNYTEARVGSYALPDPLRLLNGKMVNDVGTWLNKRRPEIIKLFEENQYGRSPGRPKDLHFEVFDKGTPAFDGKAIRRQVTIYFSKDKAGPVFRLLGKQGLDAEQMPQAGLPVGQTLRYFMHAGGHGASPSDWEQFLKFMQLHLRP